MRARAHIANAARGASRASRAVLALVGGLFAAGIPRAEAMIDPSFTPVELVDESTRVSVGKLTPSKQRDCWTFAQLRVLKGGKGGPPELSLAFPKAAHAKGRFLYHFNRGYHCMGEEGELTLEAHRPAHPPPKARGPVRAAVADFNGDGSLDPAAAFTTGQVACFLSSLFDAPGLWIRLPRGHTGPVAVSVWQGAAHPVCAGTYLVDGHSPPTYVALRKRSACTLRWRWPGRPPRLLEAKHGSAAILPRDRVP